MNRKFEKKLNKIPRAILIWLERHYIVSSLSNLTNLWPMACLFFLLCFESLNHYSSMVWKRVFCIGNLHSNYVGNKQTFQTSVFTLLDAANLSLTKLLNIKAKGRGTAIGEGCSFLETELQNLQRFYAQGGGAGKSLRTLVKFSNRPLSSVRQGGKSATHLQGSSKNLHSWKNKFLLCNKST